jgi:phage terminase large subunit-like protein
MTGAPIDGLCVIDDPIKDQKEARSVTVRKDTVAWWKTSARTRRHATTSYIVMATRWHPDDLTGYLTKKEKWRYLNLKALAEPANDNDIAEDGRVISDPLRRLPGEALWPERKPPSFFNEERTDLYWWYAMYQGVPQPIGGEIFRAPTYYRLPPGETLPDVKGFRIAYGVDLAYSRKTSSDHSVCVEIWGVLDPKLKDKVKDPDGTEHERPVIWFYIVEVARKQVDAPAFTLTLKAKHSTRPAKFYWYAAGTEKGAADFIKTKVPLVVLDTHGRDKLMRAQRTAALWNMGRIMVPLAEGDEEGESSIPWVPEFVEEVCSFTGVNDPEDDQVDGMVPAIDKLEQMSRTDLSMPGGGGGRGWSRE